MALLDISKQLTVILLHYFPLMEKNVPTLAPVLKIRPFLNVTPYAHCTYMVAMLNFGPTSDQETGMVITFFK